MELYLKKNTKTYKIDTNNVFDLSIPMIFNGEQPNSYNVPIAKAGAYQDGDFIGDVRRGGGCNFETYVITPHCNGTHTECVGHITKERISVNEVLDENFVCATLITCPIETANDSDESYYGIDEPFDSFITKNGIMKGLEGKNTDSLDGLIIRTTPNGEFKKSVNYMDHQPAYLSKEAIDYIVEIGIKHLLVDIPSLDKTFDGGRLNNHHTFWGIEFGKNDTDLVSKKTVTEMIYANESVEDGEYFLNIAVAPFTADASPSSIKIYPISD